MATDNSSDIDEEELLNYSCSSDCDDALSLCVSDAGDLLDDDSLYESVGHSASNSRIVLKPSQRNPITAPKPSHITPITAPDPLPTSSQTSQTPTAHRLSRASPVKAIETTCIASKPSMMCKKRLPCYTTSQQRSPIGAPGEKKVLKQFQRSPVKAPASRKATINTTKRSSRMLHRVTSFGEDFVFSTTTKSPMVTSDSEESSDDVPYCSRYYDTQIRDSESYGCSDRSRQESCTMEPSLSLIKAEVLSTSSTSSETNPFNIASSANDGSPFSFAARETEIKRQCRSLDSSPSVSTINSGTSPGNPFSPQRDSATSSPMGLPAHRMVDYSLSNPLTNHAGVTRKKSKVIKLNQPKVFRYVPEDLPEVELPNLATKKRATRKRGKTYPGDDCPDLLLETKRHIGEGDLRSVLTTQRTNKFSTFNDEGSSTSESLKKVTQAINHPHCTSNLGAGPSREARSRPHSPIIPPNARVTPTQTFRLESQCHVIQSPSSSPAKSGLTVIQAQKERTLAAGMSDDLRLQNWQTTNATVFSSPVKATTTQSNKTSAPLQPARDFFKSHAAVLSPAKKASSAVSEPKPSIFHHCVSIFAQRPNLMGRSSPGLNQFSLRHLDGPTSSSFALDHL